jgi:Na+-transporting NADH:ubiquinone oxidoreductase subunit C
MHSTGYTVMFAAAVCIVCSVLVSTSAVGLRSMQQRNELLDRQTNVLEAAGLIEPGQDLGSEEIQRLFNERVEPRLVNLETGEYADMEDIAPAKVSSEEAYDSDKAANIPQMQLSVPTNPAKVTKVARVQRVFHVTDEQGNLTGLVLPIHGAGLWGQLYGYLVLEDDFNTVRGITYYAHQETPGLGGEVDNPIWKQKWPGRKVYGDEGEVQLAVVKGDVGPPVEDPYKVDALSGATITSNGVTNMIEFWLGETGFGPYLDRLREGRAT